MKISRYTSGKTGRTIITVATHNNLRKFVVQLPNGGIEATIHKGDKLVWHNRQDKK